LILNHASGSTYPEISQTSFNNLNIELPPIEEQKKIGSTLRQIDTKREVNIRINEILEEMAQALYKSWFIDFEPYDDFKNTEVGRVPAGFEISEFSDICNTSGGGTPSTDVEEYWEGRNRWLTPKEVTALNSSVAYDTERKLTEKGLDNTSAKLMPTNSILLTSRATVGDVVINKKPMATNQGFICINPDDHIQPHYMLQLVKSKRKTIESLASGSTYPEISQTDFNSIEILLPPEKERQKYENKAKILYRKIHLNQKENDNLARFRDTLLPKLISGEIKLDSGSDNKEMVND
jgi:type I restriction enzyme S subunit